MLRKMFSLGALVVVAVTFGVGNAAAKSGKKVIEAKGVAKSFGDNLLFAAASPVEVRNPSSTYAHPDGTMSTEPPVRRTTTT